MLGRRGRESKVVGRWCHRQRDKTAALNSIDTKVSHHRMGACGHYPRPHYIVARARLIVCWLHAQTTHNGSGYIIFVNCWPDVSGGRWISLASSERRLMCATAPRLSALPPRLSTVDNDLLFMRSDVSIILGLQARSVSIAWQGGRLWFIIQYGAR